MTTPNDLIQGAHAFCKEHGMAMSTLSRKLLGGGLVLAQIEAGARSIRFDTLVRAIERLDAMDREAKAKSAGRTPDGEPS